MINLKLKKTEHPYYCSESNYYSNDGYAFYGKWKDFVDDWSPLEMDIDMNYIFRFDIQKYDDEKTFRLQLFIMHQRKGIFRCVEIKDIKKENMEEITKLLKIHYEYHDKLWNEFRREV